jgi:hypothetical protein
VVLGQIIYLMLYNPLTAEITEMFRFLPASVASFTVPAVAYGLTTCFLRRHRGSGSRTQPTDVTADTQALTHHRNIVEPNI